MEPSALFEPTNIKYRNSLDTYEAKVETIRKARILKFKIKWMETNVQHTQFELQGIVPDSPLGDLAIESEFDPLSPDPDLMNALGDQ